MDNMIGTGKKKVNVNKDDKDDDNDPLFDAILMSGSTPSPYLADIQYLNKKEKLKKLKNDKILNQHDKSGVIDDKSKDNGSEIEIRSTVSFEADVILNSSLEKGKVINYVYIVYVIFLFLFVKNYINNHVMCLFPPNFSPLMLKKQKDKKSRGKSVKKPQNKWEMYSKETLKHALTQREKDNINMKKIKDSFRESEFKHNLRDGTNSGA
jgi:hypothetical protein